MRFETFSDFYSSHVIIKGAIDAKIIGIII